MADEIKTNILNICERIAAAAIRAGRDPAGIRLMAVSKTVEPERIRQALDAGITLLGENYVQEAREKIPVVGRPAVWHMIGHLQTNKVKYVVNLFDWIHSVDRLELARELDKRAGQRSRRLNVLIEVNVSGEASKNGAAPGQVLELVRQISILPNVSVRGLMTMPPYSDDPENSRPCFIVLRQLRDEIVSAALPGISMDELSMGMTDDFEVAIEEGATIIRVGRAIFGERRYSPP
ncbi:MAG TPA: YggS family pyridoxal phosphate-dependent enzyme [Smithellaceae bacterium]|nr:YggS family pyridoxal phosphate-dependent enzyme [Smithellaceae bacterium]HOQ71451.1 YggS family pyridoxal phosphate-dependent enzyme [Smithellaceae bacterium]HPL09854.1 YggS family pyridoxal phosphate-dependent enzyme [Smithellaceae bacterium]